MPLCPPDFSQPDLPQVTTPRRQALVDDAVARVERASRSNKRSHRLLVGPSGIGKTSLLIEVYSRVRADPGCGSRFQIAWLPHDPWWIASYDQLLEAVLSAVEPTPQQWSGPAEEALAASAAQGGVIVVLAESFGELMDAMGLSGRRRLRALCENTRSLLFIATSREVTTAFTDVAEPFYGFFDTTRLSGFGPEQIESLLRTTKEGNLLSTDDGDLAGFGRALDLYLDGNPRMWFRVAWGVEKSPLVEWIRHAFVAVVQSLDWVSERIWSLSPAQRSIVVELGMADRCMTVKEIAGLVGSSHQSTAKSISELRASGWLRPRRGVLTGLVDKRRSYYELVDPLVGWAIKTNSRWSEDLLRQLTFLAQWFALDAWGDGPDEGLDRDDDGFLLHHKGPSQSEMSVLPLLRAADDALDSFANNRPDELLSLPSVVSHVFEDALPSGVAVLRAKLGTLALRDPGADPVEWSGRAESALDRSNARSLLVFARWLERMGHETVAHNVRERLSAVSRAMRA